MTHDKPVVIFGNGPLAEVAHFYFTHDSNRTIAAFTLDGQFIDAPAFCNLPLTPFEELEKHFPPATHDIFIALGYNNANKLRKQKFLESKNKGYGFASYISSKASVWSRDIGENAFILEDNTVQPFARIGHNVTLWSGNHIGHHVVIEDHCFITSHAVISGKTTIGEGSFLGVNATLRDNITIGKFNVIGAGALILKNTQDEEVYACEQTPLFPLKSTELKKL